MKDLIYSQRQRQSVSFFLFLCIGFFFFAVLFGVVDLICLSFASSRALDTGLFRITAYVV